MIKKRRPLFSITSLLREVICSIYICYSNKIIDGIVKNWNVYKISIRLISKKWNKIKLLYLINVYLGLQDRCIGSEASIVSCYLRSIATRYPLNVSIHPRLPTLHACPYPLPHRRTVGLLKRRTLLRNAACAIH